MRCCCNEAYLCNWSCWSCCHLLQRLERYPFPTKVWKISLSNVLDTMIYWAHDRIEPSAEANCSFVGELCMWSSNFVMLDWVLVDGVWPPIHFYSVGWHLHLEISRLTKLNPISDFLVTSCLLFPCRRSLIITDYRTMMKERLNYVHQLSVRTNMF